jgi:hypothetical protein
LEEFTQVDKWLGERRIDGKDVTSHQRLREVLGQLGLKECQQSEDIRFVIQENPWVYQYTSTQMTYWTKL